VCLVMMMMVVVVVVVVWGLMGAHLPGEHPDSVSGCSLPLLVRKGRGL
jgi:hypothetical protein